MTMPEAMPEALRRSLSGVSALIVQVDAILDRARRDSGQLLNSELGPPAKADAIHELTRLTRIVGLLRCAEAALYVARDLADSP